MAETPRRLHDVSGSNALSEFRSEADPVIPVVVGKPQTRAPGGKVAAASGAAIPAARQQPGAMMPWILVGIASVIAVAAILFFTAFRPRPNSPAVPEVRLGQVTIDTLPTGLQVLIGGQVRGITPLTLPLPPGHHDVVLRNGTEERNIGLEMTAGAEIIQRVEFAVAAPPVASTKLSVVTEPPGARVSIDGERRGLSPITVAELTPGRHRITVAGAGGTSERTVTTEAGTTTSVVFSLPKAAAPDAGWLTITSAFEVKVMERDEVIGTSASSKIMIPAGSHELDFVNSELGFQNHRKIEIEGGKTVVIPLTARAQLNANARPWAEVVIDGNAVGVTPIANHSLVLGKHQIVFRHPELGERREDFTVTMQGPNRISVDMTK